MGGRCPEGTLHAPHPADVTGCDRVSSPFRKGQLRFRNKHGKEKERRGGGSLYFHLLAKGRKGFSPQRSSSCTSRGQSVEGTAGDIHQGRKVLEGGADCDCRKEETAPPHGVPRDQEKETHVCGLPGAWRAQDPRTGGRGGPGLGGLCKMPGAELCRGSSRGGGSEPRQGGTPPGSTWGSPKLPVLGDTPEMRKGQQKNASGGGLPPALVLKEPEAHAPCHRAPRATGSSRLRCGALCQARLSADVR